ncbi:PA0069 family radical SAM protein [uncultured Litoreibacter sp.]|uniref:PA0069 family radical SAM protein n=1 Tax=uncultured Litoreibacter sp. TaxID=1392394 RepID=UPI0026123902|nr:PA0069 family radical SAM protein [uncultured Litoreibacter sp.]
METDPQIDAALRRGRGAATNRTNRFERLVQVGIDDGWGRDEDLPPVRTEVSVEVPRKVISRNSSPDLHFDRSINPYRGCEHGCIYCFARPSHAYLGLSPGLDFETRLIARPDAPALLRKELRAKRYVPRVIAIGTNTDPYQPLEKTHKIMRGLLEVLAEHRHPVAIVTKGTLIERDLDVLADLAADGLVRVGISVTTLQRDVARKAEPRVPSPARRLKTIERLAAAGVEVRLMASPMIPGLTDHELEAMLEAGRDAGALCASVTPLRLPREVSPLFQDWLAEHFPDRAKRVMALVREMHGGQDYDANFGSRMTGTGTYAALIQQRYRKACKRLGLAEKLPPLRSDLFKVPARAGDQLSLF